MRRPARAAARTSSAMIDLHSHVLPGIDDGPATAEGSVALARAAAAAGTTTLLATPHVSSRYRNTPEVIAAGVKALSGRLREEGIDIELLAGAEVSMSVVAETRPESLARLHLGEGPFLLLEPPFAPAASGIAGVAGELMEAGHRILLAHPERCPAILREPSTLRDLVAAGALTSVTAGSLAGDFGRRPRDFALWMAHERLMHSVASDAHDVEGRPPSIAAEIEGAGLSPLLEWLTFDVPRAILAGSETIPQRPPLPASAPGPRGRFRRVLRRAW